MSQKIEALLSVLPKRPTDVEVLECAELIAEAIGDKSFFPSIDPADRAYSRELALIHKSLLSVGGEGLQGEELFDYFNDLIERLEDSLR